MSIQNRCWIELDRSAFAHNLNVVRQLAPDCDVMAVIKADGYGHGMLLAADGLSSADEFAVTNLEDVQVLREAGLSKPVTMLSPTLTAEELGQCFEYKATPVVYDYTQLPALEAIRPERQIDVWLKMDTGMGRLGFTPEEIVRIYFQLDKYDGVKSISLMTHLANADAPSRVENQAQFKLWHSWLKQYESQGLHFRRLSILNSAGSVNFPDEAQDILRPGLILYGVSPCTSKSGSDLGLKPVMTLKSKVLSVRKMPRGTSIGYGGTYVIDTDTRVAYVACGYGDGFPRHAPSGSLVMINGFYVPLVGRVSMDMIAVDIQELPVEVGDEVELWGSSNPVEDLALAAGTIAYELLCGVTNRVARIEVN